MKFKRMTSLTLCSLIIIISTIGINVQAENITTKVNKDETVYAMLHHDGSVQNIKIINRLYNVEDTAVIDFGNYLAINPLRKAPIPEINNNKVIWDTTDYIGKDFYYEGTLTKELPLLFEIKYYLDDTLVEASKLAGKTGEIKIILNVKQNPDCEDAYKESYMAQIQLMLDLDHTTILSADDAVNTVAGKYSTIAYTVMPGEDKSLELVLDVEDFELKSIDIALIKNSLNIDAFDDVIKGLDEMEDGANELVSGTEDLRNGMVDLVDGLDELDNGVSNLSAGSTELEKGFSRYKDGLITYKTGIESIADGMNNSSVGLSKINDQSTLITNGYNDLYSGLNNLTTSHQQLSELANSLLTSSDPKVQALAQGILAENQALEELTTGLSASNEGLKIYTKGIKELSSGLNTLNEGIKQLPAGAEELLTGYDQVSMGYASVSDGLTQTKDGIHEMYTGVNTLPSDINKLIEGQVDLADGVKTFNDQLSESFLFADPKETVSFADSNTAIHSLQFIMKTPELKIENPEDITITDNDIVEVPWYEKIWSKLTNLFVANK